MFSISEKDIERLQQALEGNGWARASTLASFFRENSRYIAGIVRKMVYMLPESQQKGERLTEAIRDGVQVGEVGLWEALKEYDPKKGMKFSTFATARIKARVSDLFSRAGRKLGREIPYEDAGEIPEEVRMEPGPEEAVLTRMIVEQIYDKLGEREKTIAKMRAAGHRMAEIASALGVTEGRVSQIYQTKIEPVARQVARKASQGTPLTLVKATAPCGSAAGVVIDVGGRVFICLPTGGDQ